MTAAGLAHARIELAIGALLSSALFAGLTWGTVAHAARRPVRARAVGLAIAAGAPALGVVFTTAYAVLGSESSVLVLTAPTLALAVLPLAARTLEAPDRTARGVVAALSAAAAATAAAFALDAFGSGRHLHGWSNMDPSLGGFPFERATRRRSRSRGSGTWGRRSRSSRPPFSGALGAAATTPPRGAPGPAPSRPVSRCSRRSRPTRSRRRR